MISGPFTETGSMVSKLIMQHRLNHSVSLIIFDLEGKHYLTLENEREATYNKPNSSIWGNF